jgi:hypothetical protein
MLIYRQEDTDMFGNKTKYAILLFMVLALIGYSGCILTPKEEPPIKPETIWKDLTHKEDVIDNLLLCYQAHDISHYEELLHAQYLWYNQSTDVQNGYEEYYQRDEEIKRTGGLFLAADRRYPDPMKYVDRLELTITSGSWQQIAEFNGNPCDDCWETTREYTITVEMNSGTTTLQGNDNVKFTIVGVPQGAKTYYRLGRADDIKKP